MSRWPFDMLRASGCALWLALTAIPSHAAPEMGPVARALLDHMSKGLAETKVGDWVTYRLDGGGGRVSYWRMAVVGQEKDKLGRDAFWIEIDIGQHHALEAPLAQMRMLVAKETGIRSDGITRLVMAEGFDRPMEVDEASLRQSRGRPAEVGRPPGGGSGEASIRTGAETLLMTEAGSVPAVPVEILYRSTVLQRLWVSRKVPVLHLAKLEIPPIQHQMEVRDFGIDAKPRMILPAQNAPKIHLDQLEEPAGGESP